MKKQKFNAKDIVFFPKEQENSDYYDGLSLVGVVFYLLEECPWYDEMEWMRALFLKKGYKYVICCYDNSEYCDNPEPVMFRLAKGNEIQLFDKVNNPEYRWDKCIRLILDVFELSKYNAERFLYMPIPFFFIDVSSNDNSAEKFENIFDTGIKCFNNIFNEAIHRTCTIDYSEMLDTKSIYCPEELLYVDIPKKSIKEIKNDLTLKSILEGEPEFIKRKDGFEDNFKELKELLDVPDYYQIKFTNTFKKDVHKARLEGIDLVAVYKSIRWKATHKDYYDKNVDEMVRIDEIYNVVTEERLRADKDWYYIYQIRTDCNILMIYRLGKYSDLFNGEWKPI